MIDGRLLLPALAAWLGALVAGTVVAQSEPDRQGRAVLLAILAIAGLVALIAVCVTLASTGRGLRSATVALVIGTFLIGGLAACAHAASISAEPVATWVRSRATARVEAVVMGEGRRRTSAGGASWQQAVRVEVPLTASRISSRGVAVAVDLPLVLRLSADSPVPSPGSSIVVSGRLGPVAPGVDAAGSLTPIREAVVTSAPGVVDDWAHRMRSGLRTALGGTPSDGGALVAGLAVGDESLQSDDLDRAMRVTGLSHLTAVSGGNVAVIVVVVLAIVTVLGLPVIARVGAALAALAFFVILVGPQPSVLRAAVMGAVVIAGMLVGGRRAGPSVLAASVLVLVVVSTALALSWAFALSVGATAGLVLLAPSVRAGMDGWRLTRRLPPVLRDAIAITVAAQLSTLPILLLMGASTGFVSLPANLIAMPVVPAVTVLGLLAALSSPVAPALAHVLAVLASWPASWIAWVAHTGASLPLATVPWPSGPVGVGAVVAVLVSGWLLLRWLRGAFPRGVPGRLAGVAVGLALATTLLWLVSPPDRRSWPPPGWFVIMCDVGQGDALLVRSGEGAAVVVDAGPEPERVDRCINDAVVSTVSAVVLTHFHADHVDGLVGVLHGRAVPAIYVSPVREPIEQAIAVSELAEQAGIPVIPISAGDERVVGGLRWRALWPRRVINEGSVPNNASIVLTVDVAGRSILLTGDVELAAQAAILPDLTGSHFDVVKVPHHGSRDQDPRLAPLTAPSVALISVGEGNTYGHPADETIAEWEAVGALVLRTDLAGDVAVVATSDGVAVVLRR